MGGGEDEVGPQRHVLIEAVDRVLGEVHMAVLVDTRQQIGCPFDRLVRAVRNG